MSEIVLTDQNFSEEVLKNEKIVLIDFWAVWCIPCQMITPIVQEIADEFGEKIKVGKLNIDENRSIATNFEVNAIPTLILFKNGKIVQRFVGVQPKGVITEAINSAIKNEN